MNICIAMNGVLFTSAKLIYIRLKIIDMDTSTFALRYAATSISIAS